MSLDPIGQSNHVSAASTPAVALSSKASAVVSTVNNSASSLLSTSAQTISKVTAKASLERDEEYKRLCMLAVREDGLRKLRMFTEFSEKIGKICSLIFEIRDLAHKNAITFKTEYENELQNKQTSLTPLVSWLEKDGVRDMPTGLPLRRTEMIKVIFTICFGERFFYRIPRHDSSENLPRPTSKQLEENPFIWEVRTLFGGRRHIESLWIRAMDSTAKRTNSISMAICIEIEERQLGSSPFSDEWQFNICLHSEPNSNYAFSKKTLLGDIFFRNPVYDNGKKDSLGPLKANLERLETRYFIMSLKFRPLFRQLQEMNLLLNSAGLQEFLRNGLNIPAVLVPIIFDYAVLPSLELDFFPDGFSNFKDFDKQNTTVAKVSNPPK